MFISMLFPIIGCAVTGCGLKGDLEHPPHIKPIQEDVAFMLPTVTPTETNTSTQTLASRERQHPSAAY